LARGGSEDILCVRCAGNRWFHPNESDRAYLNLYDRCIVFHNDALQDMAADDGVLRIGRPYTTILVPEDRVQVENVPPADQDQ